MGDNSSVVSTDSDLRTYALNGKIMLCSVILLFIVVVFLICFQVYTRWLVSRARHRRSISGHRRQRRILLSASVSRRGLDPLVLKSLPTFVYAAAANSKGLDCAVCLSEFEDNEMGRVLPECNHSFHIACIDRWFKSDPTCPLCRAPRDCTEVGSVSGLNPSSRNSENNRCGESDLLQVGCLRKPLELVGVAAELAPRRDEGLEAREEIVERGSGSGSKYPDNRIPSFRRFLSV
ncbi:hypothetical protein Nepgr_027778 [Nepenthes gracilis]|uniref:RING-type E3 ubiquitin transferase n=1 Tax=Nepenthes gracilis TaxID=150966 RepID=A0AAD3Y3A6_NEPGR|nr:hypothetical protein Nepgr_027778 [Nepenthes gracilis]